MIVMFLDADSFSSALLVRLNKEGGRITFRLTRQKKFKKPWVLQHGGEAVVVLILICVLGLRSL